MTSLEVRSLGKRFGGLQALRGVTFGVEQGTVTSLIGPNGSGKSTCFNLITGLYLPDSGEILFHGKRITSALPYEVARLGIARTFQRPRLFREMSVLENVMVGCVRRMRSGFLGCALALPGPRRELEEAKAVAHRCLELLSLGHLAATRADGLSTGQQRLLEIARALAVEPELLLLDEPAAGLNDRETEVLTGLIGRLRAQGYSMLIVEHNMDLVMTVSDAVVVLNYGEKIAEGTPAEVKQHPDVLDAYLGTGGLAGSVD